MPPSKIFKVVDLAFKVNVLDGREEAKVQLHHRTETVVAEADLITCGRSNPIGAGPAGGIEFDVRFDGVTKFKNLREALRHMLAQLDDIDPQV